MVETTVRSGAILQASVDVGWFELDGPEEDVVRVQNSESIDATRKRLVNHVTHEASVSGAV